MRSQLYLFGLHLAVPNQFYTIMMEITDENFTRLQSLNTWSNSAKVVADPIMQQQSTQTREQDVSKVGLINCTLWCSMFIKTLFYHLQRDNLLLSEFLLPEMAKKIENTLLENEDYSPANTVQPSEVTNDKATYVWKTSETHCNSSAQA